MGVLLGLFLGRPRRVGTVACAAPDGPSAGPFLSLTHAKKRVQCSLLGYLAARGTHSDRVGILLRTCPSPLSLPRPQPLTPDPDHHPPASISRLSPIIPRQKPKNPACAPSLGTVPIFMAGCCKKMGRSPSDPRRRLLHNPSTANAQNPKPASPCQTTT
jgi:hypothetical protein